MMVVCTNILVATTEAFRQTSEQCGFGDTQSTYQKQPDQNFWVRCFGVDFASLDLITAHTEGFVGNFDTKQYGTYSPTIDAVVWRC